jgi:hypothetical protein
MQNGETVAVGVARLVRKGSRSGDFKGQMPFLNFREANFYDVTQSG